MWHQITGQTTETTLLQCTAVAGHISCQVYNLSEAYCERITLEEMTKRSKNKNRRVQFDEATVLDVVQNSMPVEATWKVDDDLAILELKYQVRSFPFRFEWNLTKQNSHEINKLIIQPLFTSVFTSVNALTQQIAEMREAIRKKDLEIAQYKKEGGELKRKTVATAEFNFAEFDDKYAVDNATAHRLEKMAEHFQNVQTEQDATIPAPTVAIKAEIVNNKLKKSPRKRKRQAMDVKQDLLKQNFKAKNEKLLYGSQSMSAESD